jgi:hypothetical protein
MNDVASGSSHHLCEHPVRPALLRIFAIICALHVSGAHWALLQSVAWTGMLVSRSQQTGVEEAVRTTFDGEHPCRLCVVVKEGQKQQSEKRPDSALELMAKTNFLQPAVALAPAPASVAFNYRILEIHGAERAESPRLQPPRVA